MSLENQIMQGDCLDVMRQWPDECIDMVMCSPPYEDARLYNMDFNLKRQDWVDWAMERYIECVRVCKGLVAWVVEGRTRNFRWSATPALLMADLHHAGIKLRKPPIFQRVGIPGSGGPDWLRNDYEFIVCSSKGRLPWSDNTAMGHPPKWAPGGEMSYRQSDGARVNQWGHAKGSGGTQMVNGRVRSGKERPSYRETKRYDRVTKANPGNVIKCKVGGGLMGDRICHENEAPYPESLCEFFVRSFCPPGGIVFDPFCGSGTTCSVALAFGRKYIGIDIRESEVEKTTRRISRTQLKFT